jgi:hypothetical protein
MEKKLFINILLLSITKNILCMHKIINPKNKQIIENVFKQPKNMMIRSLGIIPPQYNFINKINYNQNNTQNIIKKNYYQLNTINQFKKNMPTHKSLSPELKEDITAFFKENKLNLSLHNPNPINRIYNTPKYTFSTNNKQNNNTQETWKDIKEKYSQSYPGALYTKHPFWGYRTVQTIPNTLYTLIHGQEYTPRYQSAYNGIPFAVNPAGLSKKQIELTFPKEEYKSLNDYLKNGGIHFNSQIALETTKYGNYGFAFNLKDYRGEIASPRKGFIKGELINYFGYDIFEMRLQNNISKESITAIICNQNAWLKEGLKTIEDLFFVGKFFDRSQPETQEFLKPIQWFVAEFINNNEIINISNESFESFKSFKDKIIPLVHEYYTKKFDKSNYNGLDIINDCQNILAQKYPLYKKLNVYNISTGDMIMTADGQRVLPRIRKQ